ncbi:MAG: imidazole glycerol phosphate synthase subunit HisH [Deltaproteobacteria bacterium]|nr:imidazole glycerol phosphate synthase subunit HisH [Candidatus Anaeroferrophillus wilburensis]MBN2888640.1 imidazole glycerol phosphate synthase subunit HisH [Deltaproteobacteria bacterium]
MIVIVDYGMGNLRSVQKAVEKAGFAAEITRSAGKIADARGIILPGVGAFKDCMENLDRYALIQPVLNSIAAGKPFLGICLGLQVLFSESQEFGAYPGLDVVKGSVVPFSHQMPDPDVPGACLKIPHMGWNVIRKQGEVPQLQKVADGDYFYFVHSYYVIPDDPAVIATTTDYGIDFVSSIHKDNIFATQFHPEKSQQRGLHILEAFGKQVGS